VGADAGPSGSDAGESAEARTSNRPAAALGGGETRATAASSSTLSTVERGVRGPVGKSATLVRFFHFATVFGLIA
jgi:hypothetical protein